MTRKEALAEWDAEIVEAWAEYQRAEREADARRDARIEATYRKYDKILVDIFESEEKETR